MTLQSLFPEPGLAIRPGTVDEANWLLAAAHYLGPVGRGRQVFVATVDGDLVGCQVWAFPTARYLPSDGSWLELIRWCLTPCGVPNLGSRMHRVAVRNLRTDRRVTTLVSYSDPSQGHTGSLYRACNWTAAPTWHRLRPPPTGNGSWDGRRRQEVKDRWVFPIRRDPRRAEILRLKDDAIVRRLDRPPNSRTVLL